MVIFRPSPDISPFELAEERCSLTRSIEPDPHEDSLNQTVQREQERHRPIVIIIDSCLTSNADTSLCRQIVHDMRKTPYLSDKVKPTRR